MATIVNKNDANQVIVPQMSNNEKENLHKSAENEGRKLLHKTTSVEVIKSSHQSGMIEFTHKNRLDVNTTDLSPEQTADIIIKHIKKIS